ncbi:MAG: YggS family pyridoxal phosphate-dependent enzyme [Actinocatenispora sp.]
MRAHPDPQSTRSGRRDELAANLAAVQARIAAACSSAGRSADEVTLIAVTKTFPASDVRILADLGQLDVGENRDAEAASKAADLAAAGIDVRWHFIGQLQRNKCRSVVGYADLVHSVDRTRLVTALARVVPGPEARQDVLIQVSLDDDEDRGGVPVGRLEELVSSVLEQEVLRLRGLMAVAPLGVDPDRAFGTLAERAAWLRSVVPDAGIVSAGMTADLEQAIAHGATHVRVGGGLLGRRATLG